MITHYTALISINKTTPTFKTIFMKYFNSIQPKLIFKNNNYAMQYLQ